MNYKYEEGPESERTDMFHYWAYNTRKANDIILKHKYWDYHSYIFTVYFMNDHFNLLQKFIIFLLTWWKRILLFYSPAWEIFTLLSINS